MKNPFGPIRRGTPSGGEKVDSAAHTSIHLAHEALERFPDVVKRHRFIAGGAAVSSSLIALAGVAIARRISAGQTAEEAIASVTEDEIQGKMPEELRRKTMRAVLDAEAEAVEAAAAVEAALAADSDEPLDPTDPTDLAARRSTNGASSGTVPADPPESV